MEQYRLEAKKGEGTFSEVFMAQSIKTHKLVAIKCMKKKYETIEKVKKLKEIQALKLLTPHEHIIKLIEVLYDEPTGTSPPTQANSPSSSNSWSRISTSAWSATRTCSRSA
jgi:serine/threonine protein kinase